VRTLREEVQLLGPDRREEFLVPGRASQVALDKDRIRKVQAIRRASVRVVIGGSEHPEAGINEPLAQAAGTSEEVHGGERFRGGHDPRPYEVTRTLGRPNRQGRLSEHKFGPGDPHGMPDRARAFVMATMAKGAIVHADG
jgi:hypothetical protein